MIFNILERMKVEAKDHIAYWGGDENYQVISASGGAFTVERARRSCSCNKWNLNGIPCPHAVACISHKDEEPEDWVSEWYKKEMYLKTYAYQIFAIRNQEEWPDSGKRPMTNLIIRSNQVVLSACEDLSMMRLFLLEARRLGNSSAPTTAATVVK